MTLLSSEVSEILESLAQDIDLPARVYEEAVRCYGAVADWLGADGSAILEHSPIVYPQGSFRLGTAIRPLRETDEVDVDLVCRLALQKTQTTQDKLKGRVGDRLKAHPDFAEILEERRRCWTLNYPGQFHLDVLPAILSDEGDDNCILLTDLDLVRWQHSNPIGYADWFYGSMVVRLTEAKQALAKAAGIEIEDVPEWSVRTPLQRAVQLLKRHRDLYFGCENDDRPVSIIITTLAAKAYAQEGDLQEALSGIAKRIPSHIQRRGDQWWVENPANPRENFADKWNEKPAKHEAFMRWLDKAQTDLGKGRLAKTVTFAEHQLAANFRGPIASAGRLITLAEAVPALGNDAHRRMPPWPMAPTMGCQIRGEVCMGFRGRRLNWPVGQRSIPRGMGLRFHVAKTNVPRPYEVFWQIVNTGSEAANRKGLRGGFDPSNGGDGVRWETTEYVGTHTIEAFVVKDGRCLARSGRKNVLIR